MLTVSTDQALLDLDLVHHYLSDESYWAKGIPRDVLERSIAHSLCFAAYDEGRQIGFARVISDFATFAYLADVFVVESHRGKSVAREIMRAIGEHPDLQRLRRWHLVTRDAHELYRGFGFRELASPERHMEKVDPGVYRPAEGIRESFR